MYNELDSGMTFKCQYRIWRINAPSGTYYVIGPITVAEEMIEELRKGRYTCDYQSADMFEIVEMEPNYKKL